MEIGKNVLPFLYFLLLLVGLFENIYEVIGQFIYLFPYFIFEVLYDCRGNK